VHQPPSIRHREIAHSDDLELLEIVMPADFETVGVDQVQAPQERSTEALD
jgi:hypothetical protein